MDHHGGPGHEAPPQRELCLVRRLRIIDVGGRPAGAAPGKVDQPRELAGDKRGAKMFRRSEGRRARFHVNIRRKGAIADGRARTGKLGERYGGKRLGMAECHGRLDGDRRHRAHQCEGGDDRQLPMAGEIDQPLRHRDVDLARRIGVDDGVAVAFRHEAIIVEAAKIAHHLETFTHLRGAAAEDVRQLVGFQKLRFHGEVVAQIGWNILRFDQGRHHLQHVKMLRHFHKLAKIAGRSRATSPFQVGGMGRAGARLEHEAPRLEKHIPVGAAAAAQDRAWRGFQRRCHHLASDPDHLAGVVDAGATGTEHLPRLGKQDLHPQILKGCQRGVMHRRDGVIGIELHLRERIAKPPVIDIANRLAALACLPSASATAGRCLRVHAMISPLPRTQKRSR